MLTANKYLVRITLTWFHCNGRLSTTATEYVVNLDHSVNVHATRLRTTATAMDTLPSSMRHRHHQCAVAAPATFSGRGGYGGRKCPVGVQERSTGREAGECSPEAEAFCRHCLHILTAKRSKFEFALLAASPDSCPVCFTVGLSDIPCLLPPLPISRHFYTRALLALLTRSFCMLHATF